MLNKEMLTQSNVGLNFRTLPSGRKLARHPNNEGSVLQIDMFGRTVNLFIADAKYRAHKQFGTYGTDVPNLDNFTQPNSSSNWYLKNGTQSDNNKQPLGYTLSDSQLQALWPSLRSDKTAKENCNIWMTYNSRSDSYSPPIQGVPAVAYCRSLNVGGLGPMDLPNEYELMCIYLESDEIDKLDPTSNKKYHLGMNSQFGRFTFSDQSNANVEYANYAWSSTEYGSNHVRYVYYDGHCYGNTKYYAFAVLPVLELAL